VDGIVDKCPTWRELALTQAQQALDDWKELQAILKAGVSEGNWDTWLSRLEPDFRGDTPILVAPSEFHLRWVIDKHGDLITSAFRERYGTDASPQYRVNESLQTEYDDTGEQAADEPTPVEPDGSAATGPGSALITRYRFESFVVGQSNRFAWAAAMAVAEQPGAHYNPLFIYGGAGLGKTHLLNAVGHQALEMYPSLVVRYVSSENFLNDFIDSIRRKRPDDFKQRYRGVDILLLDDVQFFEGRSRSSRSSSTRSTPYTSRASRWSSARTDTPGISLRWRTASGAGSSGDYSPTSSPPTWRLASPSSAATPSSPRDRCHSRSSSTSPAWCPTTSGSWRGP
jgi:hypothetical protein